MTMKARNNISSKNLTSTKQRWIVAGMSLLVATGLGTIGNTLTTHANASVTNTRANTKKTIHNNRHAKLVRGRSYKLHNTRTHAKRLHHKISANNHRISKRRYESVQKKHNIRASNKHYVITRTAKTSASDNSASTNQKHSSKIISPSKHLVHSSNSNNHLNGFVITYVNQAGKKVTTKNVGGTPGSTVTIGKYPARVPVAYHLAKGQKTHYKMPNSVQHITVHIVGTALNGKVLLHLRYVMNNGKIWHQNKYVIIRAHLGDNTYKIDPNKFNRGRYHTVDSPMYIPLNLNAPAGFLFSRSFSYSQNRTNQSPKQNSSNNKSKKANNEKKPSNNNIKPKVVPKNHSNTPKSNNTPVNPVPSDTNYPKTNGNSNNGNDNKRKQPSNHSNKPNNSNNSNDNQESNNNKKASNNGKKPNSNTKHYLGINQLHLIFYNCLER